MSGCVNATGIVAMTEVRKSRRSLGLASLLYLLLAVVELQQAEADIYPATEFPQDPVAQFSYSPSAPAIGERIQFINTSTCFQGPCTYAWWFDWDGDWEQPDSTQLNPYHTYWDPGIHEVMLLVFDHSCGGSSIDGASVEVQWPISIQYSPLHPAAGEPVCFSASFRNTTPPYTYKWVFWDYHSCPPIDTRPSPCYVFPLRGTYIVDLRVTDADDIVGSATSHIVVREGPTELIGLEVVQVIQDWRNSVPLIEGKETYVRAHIRSTTGEAKTAKAVLRGFRDDEELPGCPLEAMNSGHLVQAQPAGMYDRGNWGHSLNFRITPELVGDWLKGTVRFQLEQDGYSYIEFRDPGNDGSVTVTFQESPQLKVKFVKVGYRDEDRNYQIPTSLQLDELKQRLLAMYPVASVDVAPHGALPFSYLERPDLLLVLEDLKDYSKDECERTGDCSRIYYGALTNEPLGDHTSGVTHLNANDSVGYIPKGDFDNGRNTHTHELGHCLGRLHPRRKEDSEGPCGSKKGHDINFPYYIYFVGGADEGWKATIGPMGEGDEDLVYGYDTHAKLVIDPMEHFEVMSYCNPWKWISKYTYEGILEALPGKFGAPSPGPPLGVSTSGSGDVLLVRGRINLDSDSVTFSPFSLVPDAIVPPAERPGEYNMTLLDKDGDLIDSLSFEALECMPDGPGEDERIGLFVVAVWSDPNMQEVTIDHNGVELASIAASPNRPTVEVMQPNGGETFAGDNVEVRWSAEDADGDRLVYMVQYSPDNGISWETFSIARSEPNITLGREALIGSEQGLIRVIASDGFNTAVDESDGVFSVANNAPRVMIVEPGEGTFFAGNQLIVFRVLARDREDGPVEDANIVWTSSIDGEFGYGEVFSWHADWFSEGEHVITATATDSNDLSGFASVTIRTSWMWCDLNLDGAVDLADLAIVGAQWLQPPGSPSADVVPYWGDGIVNMRDLEKVATQWLEGAGP
ncbi:MAG: PKD domain-containing protein [Sedimentisphaerales bacterium]|nr:PKD domain-containing protein [Sedimentisphaerales bacterium]